MIHTAITWLFLVLFRHEHSFTLAQGKIEKRMSVSLNDVETTFRNSYLAVTYKKKTQMLCL